MSKQKRYTAQEMREKADYCDSVAKEAEDIQKIGLEAGEAVPECFYRTICNLLRQAAATEEENAQFKTRLETVVKMLEEEESRTSCNDCNSIFGDSKTEECECRFSEQHSIYEKILLAARGEGGASDGK